MRWKFFTCVGLMVRKRIKISTNQNYPKVPLKIKDILKSDIGVLVKMIKILNIVSGNSEK